MMIEVYLYYIISLSTGDAHPRMNRVRMESMQVCNEAVKAAKIEIPEGGDAESTVTVFCGGSDMKTRFLYTDGKSTWE
jgi:hypothetical protein